jgi:hypothetical protein
MQSLLELEVAGEYERRYCLRLDYKSMRFQREKLEV